MNKNLLNNKFLLTGEPDFGVRICATFFWGMERRLFALTFSNGKLDNIKHLKNEKDSDFTKEMPMVSEIRKVFMKKPDYVMHYAAMVGVKEQVKTLWEFLRISKV